MARPPRNRRKSARYRAQKKAKRIRKRAQSSHGKRSRKWG